MGGERIYFFLILYIQYIVFKCEEFVPFIVKFGWILLEIYFLFFYFCQLLTDLDRWIQLIIKNVYVRSISIKDFAPFVSISGCAEKLSLSEQSKMQFLHLLAFIFFL